MYFDIKMSDDRPGLLRFTIGDSLAGFVLQVQHMGTASHDFTEVFMEINKIEHLECLGHAALAKAAFLRYRKSV